MPPEFPVSILGLALRAWAAGHLEKDSTLTDSGPYAWVRNPLYLGTLTAAAGFVIASRRWELGVLFAAVFVLIYLPVVDLEEQHLARLFPAYSTYMQRVHKLIPRCRTRCPRTPPNISAGVCTATTANTRPCWDF